jgi:hypothetical protein
VEMTNPSRLLLDLENYKKPQADPIKEIASVLCLMQFDLSAKLNIVVV